MSVGVRRNANTLPDLLIRNSPQAQRIRSVFGAPTRERDYRSSGQDRTQIELYFVNEACIKRLAEQFAAALDENARDISVAQIFQHPSQRPALIDQRSTSQLVGKQMSAPWQLSRASQHDAPGLARATNLAHRQPRIVRSDCFRSNQNGVHACAKLIGVTTT
jgi:hypothetical protein